MHTTTPLNRRPSLLSLAALSLLALSACDGLVPGDGVGGDGGGVTILDAVPEGAFVITEVQAEPNVGRPEYIEILNTTDSAIDLIGCQLVDGGGSSHDFTVYDSVVVEAGEYALFGAADYLGDTEGEIAVQVNWYSVITLNQGDTEEDVSLYCPDGVGTRQLTDSVAFDWDALGVRKGHAWQLYAEPNATTNDESSNWCEAPGLEEATYAIVDGQPDYGSPGGPAVCDEAMGSIPSQAGDIVISEILVKQFEGLSEWIELSNPGDKAFDLRGCVLIDQAVGADNSREHTLDNKTGTTVISAGGTLVLSKTDTAIAEDGSVLSDYPYTSLNFNDSGDESLRLSCPKGTELITIDEIIYNWETWGDEYRGYTLSLNGSSLDAEANDDRDAWCLADDTTPYFTTTITDDDDNSETFNAYGSPGSPNPDCAPLQPYPAEGELVISEIMAHSSSELGADEEWIELYNASSAAVRLDGCTIENRDPEDSSGSQEVVSGGQSLSIEAGSFAVLARSGATESIACGLSPIATYGSLSLSNSAPKVLSISCPGGAGDLLIDSINYDGGFDAGYSWQLRQNALDATSNDNEASWCSDTSTDSSNYPWSCPTDTPYNFGSPGQTSTCS